MTETFNNFQGVIGDAKAVWNHVTYVVEQMFQKELGLERGLTIGNVNPDSRQSRYVYIWQIMRTRSCKVIQQYGY